jgi:hypothetical protein
MSDSSSAKRPSAADETGETGRETGDEKRPKTEQKAGDDVRSVLSKLTEVILARDKRMEKAVINATKLLSRQPPVVRAEHAENAVALFQAAFGGVDAVGESHVALFKAFEAVADDLGLRTRVDLVSMRFRVVVCADLQSDQFSDCLRVLRAEIARCCTTLQEAKLQGIEAPTDVTRERAAALFAALAVVRAQSSVSALRAHAHALLSDAVSNANKAPSFFSPEEREALLQWRAEAGAPGRLKSGVGTERLVKDARAKMGDSRTTSFDAHASRVSEGL